MFKPKTLEPKGVELQPKSTDWFGYQPKKLSDCVPQPYSNFREEVEHLYTIYTTLLVADNAEKSSSLFVDACVLRHENYYDGGKYQSRLSVTNNLVTLATSLTKPVDDRDIARAREYLKFVLKYT